MCGDLDALSCNIIFISVGLSSCVDKKKGVGSILLRIKIERMV